MNSDHVPHSVGQGARVVSADVIPATVVSRHKLATLAGMTRFRPSDTPTTVDQSSSSEPVTQHPLRLAIAHGQGIGGDADNTVGYTCHDRWHCLDGGDRGTDLVAFGRLSGQRRRIVSRMV